MTSWHIPNSKIYLASASQTRIKMLRLAGLVFEAQASSVDEQAIKQAGIAENIEPADIAITLAEVKAGKLASQKDGYIIGCDQLLSCEGEIFSKPASMAQAADHLQKLAGKTHQLYTAAVVFQHGRRIWHHCSRSELAIRRLGQQDIAEYLDFCGQDALLSPGCYQIEAGGAYLFSDIKGVYYDILGLPLLPLLAFLREHGLCATASGGGGLRGGSE
jgi:septum formation protein